MILRIFNPDCGRVEVLGQDTGDCADERVGYLPEERGLYRRMKVRDLLRYYARLKGFRRCEDEITWWLKRLGAEGWDNRRIESLSKGMSQKVQFIAAVVAKPQLLILDEPFSGLDPVNLELLREAIQEVRGRGTTIIFSTHEMDVAERMCERVFMIHQGRKVLDGTIAQIQQQYTADEVRVRTAPWCGTAGISSGSGTAGDAWWLQSPEAWASSASRPVAAAACTVHAVGTLRAAASFTP
jgi:ABC-2 type transport system ATP-binding protein